MNPTHKTINIPVYFDSQSRPTCSEYIDKNCMFLRFRSFGTKPICAFVSDGLTLDRYDELGCITPHNKCPLHGGDDEVDMNLIAEALNQPVKTCKWTLVDSEFAGDESYQTACDKVMQKRIHPAAKWYKACPYCSGVIEL